MTSFNSASSFPGIPGISTLATSSNSNSGNNASNDGGDASPSNDAYSGLPTVEQINRALAESGERERLKAMLKARLWECGWHEQLRSECLAELKRRGVDKIGPHELANSVGPQAKASIPNSVKEHVIREIEAFLDKVIVTQPSLH